MLALRRPMILRITVFLIILTVLLSIGQVVGSASEANATLITENDTTPPDPVTDVSLRVLPKFEVRELKSEEKDYKTKISGQLISLTWTASDDPYFMRYEIYVSTDPSVLGTKIKEATIVDVNTTTYDKIEIGVKGNENLGLGVLDPDTTYYLSVVVVDRAGLSSEAATVSVTTNGPLNWTLMGGIAVAVEVAIAAIFVVIKLFIKKE